MKAATGRCEGRKPYGSRPGERETVKRMRAWRASGQTFAVIAEGLNREQIPTRVSGRRWDPRTVQLILKHAA
jgi:hypothetical protein